MSWACGGRCPCKPEGRRLFDTARAFPSHLSRGDLRVMKGQGLHASGCALAIALPADKEPRSRLLDRDLLLALLGFRRLRQRHRERAILELSLNWTVFRYSMFSRAGSEKCWRGPEVPK